MTAPVGPASRAGPRCRSARGSYPLLVSRRCGDITMPETITLPDVEEKEEIKTRRVPPYNVVLLNDDDHSYAYVIVMLQELFGYPPEKGFQLAKEVDTTGRVIVFTGPLEVAELKRDQIHAY